MANEDLSNADLELLYLTTIKGATGPSLADAREQVYIPNEHAYFAALSGLSSGSVSDHALAYYRTQVDPDDISLADTARLFWLQKLAGGGGAWSPADLTGLALWLDGDDASTFTFSSGNVVSQWGDKSGNGRNFAQATVAQQPTRSVTLNGHSAVKFDATDDVLNYTGPEIAPAQPVTVVCVVRIDGGNFVVIDNTTSGRILIQGFVGGNWRMFGGSVLDGGVAVLGSLNSMVMVFNGASSDLRQNGASAATGNAGTNGFGSGAGTYVLGSAADIVIGEFIVVAGAVSGADLTSLESYLGTKWGTH